MLDIKKATDVELKAHAFDLAMKQQEINGTINAIHQELALRASKAKK